MQQCITRIIDYLVELKSEFYHLGEKTVQGQLTVNPTDFPSPVFTNELWIFPTTPLQQKKILDLLLLQELFFPPTNLLEQWVYLPSTQSPAFQSEVTSKGDKCQRGSAFTSLAIVFRWCWDKQVHQHHYSWIIKDRCKKYKNKVLAVSLRLITLLRVHKAVRYFQFHELTSTVQFFSPRVLNLRSHQDNGFKASSSCLNIWRKSLEFSVIYYKRTYKDLMQRLTSKFNK